jgi:uncharacterized protein YacL
MRGNYVGTVIGGICIIFLSKMIQRNLVRNMTVGSFLFAVFVLLYGFNSIPIIALLLCVLMGLIVDVFGVRIVYIVRAIFFCLSVLLSFLFETNRVGKKQETRNKKQETRNNKG